MAEDIERVFVVPLGKVKDLAPRTKRSPRAIREVRKFVARHMKTDEEKVWLDTSVNEAVWALHDGVAEPDRRPRLQRLAADPQRSQDDAAAPSRQTRAASRSAPPPASLC